MEDLTLGAVLGEVQSKFENMSYTDESTGVTLKYYLFVPGNYDNNTKYPLVSFIHDDSVTGKGEEDALTQGYGGVIWATALKQMKHASFVLMPYFETSTIAGGAGQSGSEVVEAQVQTYYDLLQEIQKKYSIASNRLYQTGQSMGGMTSFYLNSKSYHTPPEQPTRKCHNKFTQKTPISHKYHHINISIGGSHVYKLPLPKMSLYQTQPINRTAVYGTVRTGV